MTGLTLSIAPVSSNTHISQPKHQVSGSASGGNGSQRNASCVPGELTAIGGRIGLPGSGPQTDGVIPFFAGAGGRR